MKRTPLIRALAVAAAIATLTAACGSDDEESSDGKTAISWWHNSNTDPGKGYYEQVAKDFEADNPDVDIKIEALQHEDMLTKLDAAFQSGDAPDIYMERGGGELADHVEAGLTKDLSESSADIISQVGGSVAGWQSDGKTYALPFSVGVVGFWYNKDLFAQAGITETPTTWDEMYAVIDQLKTAGLEPIAVGAGDKWPAAHYWYYFSVRECAEDVLTDAVTSLDFSDECFVRAGEDLQELVEAEPFNKGFLSTPGAGGPDQRLRPPGHREGRDGAPGPLGARRDAGPDRGRGGARRQDRLVRVPHHRDRRGRPGGDVGRRRRLGRVRGCPGRGGRLRELPALRRGPEGVRRAGHGTADHARRHRLRVRPGSELADRRA